MKKAFEFPLWVGLISLSTNDPFFLFNNMLDKKNEVFLGPSKLDAVLHVLSFKEQSKITIFFFKLQPLEQNNKQEIEVFPLVPEIPHFYNAPWRKLEKLNVEVSL